MFSLIEFFVIPTTNLLLLLFNSCAYSADRRRFLSATNKLVILNHEKYAGDAKFEFAGGLPKLVIIFFKFDFVADRKYCTQL